MTSSSGGASDLYAVLEIDRNATAAQIKKAYRRLALKWHPDKNGNDIESNEKFKAISAAYDVLGDTQRRKQYDTSGRTDNRQAEDLNPYEVFEKAFAGYKSSRGDTTDNPRPMDKVPRMTDGNIYNISLGQAGSP